jgi:hypothetical protein
MPDIRTAWLNPHNAADITDPLDRARELICDALIVLEGSHDVALPTRGSRRRVIRKDLIEVLSALGSSAHAVERIVREQDAPKG